MPSYQRLKTMVRRHTDQIRMRNIKKPRMRGLRQEYWSRVTKERKVSVDSKVGECYQWKTTGQCSRGDSCSFSHGSNRGQKAQSSSPAPKTQTQTDGRKALKMFGTMRQSFSGRKGQKACKHFFKGKCTDPSCDYCHPPVCQNYKSVSGCKFGDQCLFRHTEADGQPTKK